MTVSDDHGQTTNVGRRNILLGGTTLAAASAIAPVRTAQAQQQPAATPSGSEPNILFIMGDDIGWYNISAYNMGMMGYRTPNIDRKGRTCAGRPDSPPINSARGPAAVFRRSC
jgi:hypothetical protein